MARLALLAAAAICLLLAGVGAYGRYAVLDEGRFADRATSALSSDEVRDEIASRVANRVVADRPELSAGRTAFEDAAKVVAADPAFAAAFHTALARMHHTLFSDAHAQASLTVAGSGAMLHTELQRRAGTDLPRIGDPPLMSIGADGREDALRTLAPVAKRLALPLTIASLLAGLALLAIGVAREPDARRRWWSASLTVAAAGGLAAAAVTGARDIVLTDFDTGFGDAVVTQIWNAYLGDLRTWGLAVGAAGLVAAAAAGGPRLTPEILLAAPGTRAGRLLRAAALLAAAVVAIEVPELVLHVGLVALAGALLYVAAGDLLRVLAPPHSAARTARAATATCAMLALIAVAAVPASGVEPPAATASAPATAATAAKRNAAPPAAKAHARKRDVVCVTEAQARRLATQGMAMPADAERRADGRICVRR
jgi:hypothetical protein